MLSLIERIKIGKKKVGRDMLIQKVADRLVGIAYEDLTTAERQICDLLIINGILTIKGLSDTVCVEVV